jgi:hypothetical protein
MRVTLGVWIELCQGRQNGAETLCSRSKCQAQSLVIGSNPAACRALLSTPERRNGF